MTAPPRPRPKRVLANETNPTFSICNSGDPYRMSNRRQQGDDCPVAEHEDRDQGREDRRRAREGDGELPALSGRDPRIGTYSRGDASSCRSEDREGVWLPGFPDGNPALTQSL